MRLNEKYEKTAAATTQSR